MYKVGKVFMEDVKITIDSAGHRIVTCPICDEEIRIADDELIGDTILCEICDTPLKIVE